VLRANSHVTAVVNEDKLNEDKRALGYLGQKLPGHASFPFSHIVPRDETRSIGQGGWLCITLGAPFSNSPRLSGTLTKKKGDRTRPKHAADFEAYASRQPVAEFFQGWEWAAKPGPLAGPRDRIGQPEPLVTAYYKCGSKTCKGRNGGGCGFEMIQELHAFSREENMIRVRFVDWDARE